MSALLSEIQAACGNALLSPALGGDACGGFSFDVGFSPNPIDGITFEIDPESVRAQWLPPKAFYNERPVRQSAGDDPSGGSCSVDSDCKAGLACTAGICSCDASHACPFAFTCNEASSRCEFQEVACTEDRDCAVHPEIGIDESRCGSSGFCERRVAYSFDGDDSSEHPVLAIDVRWRVTDTDEDDAVAAFVLPVQIQDWTTRFRIQPIPCV